MSSIPLLLQSSPNSCDDIATGITLGQYLSEVEQKNHHHVNYLFSICGGLHVPYQIPGFGYVQFWKMCLYVGLLGFFGSNIAVIVYYIAKEGISIQAVIFVSFLAQAIITIPVIKNTSTRIGMKLSENQSKALPDTIRICKQYTIISVAVSSLYYILVIWGVCIRIESGQQSTINNNLYTIMMVLFGVTPICVSLLSMWGLFFIVLDAKVLEYDILDLRDASNVNELTVDMYNKVYYKHIEDNQDSIVILDGIAIVAYISVLICITSCVLLSSEYGMNPVIFIICEVTLQFREAFLIYFALPCISQASGTFDDFSGHMSNLHGTSQISSTMIADANSPVQTLLEKNSIHPSEISLSDLNKRVSNIDIWICTINRPLIMYMLGRKIQKKEARVQFITFSVLALGSFGSFIVGQIISASRN